MNHPGPGWKKRDKLVVSLKLKRNTNLLRNATTERLASTRC